MTAAPRAALEARAVVRDLGGTLKTRILHGIDLVVRPGELLSITGPSGSGKSTLLYLLGVLDRPTSGEILVEGETTSSLDDDARSHLRNERLGFVFQFHFLLPELNALENVIVPMLRRGDPREEARHRGTEVLASLGLEGLERRLPAQLSGGQQQRVAIARAIAHRPRIVLADEPTGNLDSVSGEQVISIFEGLVRDGLTVVMVTHEPSYAARARREVRLRDGRVVEIVER
jgi:lipoprotein-releasing system ATP-binding protein